MDLAILEVLVSCLHLHLIKAVIYCFGRVSEYDEKNHEKLSLEIFHEKNIKKFIMKKTQEKLRWENYHKKTNDEKIS